MHLHAYVCRQAGRQAGMHAHMHTHTHTHTHTRTHTHTQKLGTIFLSLSPLNEGES